MTRFIRHKKPHDWTGPKPSKSGKRIYCGAWSRTRGRPCRQAPCGPSGRCRMHSGKGDSGPRTVEGKARIAEAQRKAWARTREQLGLPPWWRSTANQVCKQKRKRLGLTAADYIAKHGRWQSEEKGST